MSPRAFFCHVICRHSLRAFSGSCSATTSFSFLLLLLCRTHKVATPNTTFWEALEGHKKRRSKLNIRNAGNRSRQQRWRHKQATQPTQQTGPTTRSRDNTLPPAINRFTATVNPDEANKIARQPPVESTFSRSSNNTPSENDTFARDFRELFLYSTT